MTATLVGLVFSASAPRELASFWAHALRWNISELGGGVGGVELVPTDATGFRLRFRPGAREKVGQNRIHFDLTTSSPDDRDTTIVELLAVGGRHVDIGQDPNDSHVVLADPEGNEFCIIDPTNRFLAGCPRLGAVNCDGTQALGHFWSKVLGWPLVWDQDEETAIQAPNGTGPKITWSGPPLMPTWGEERLHFHIAPGHGDTEPSVIQHLLGLGATLANPDRTCQGATAFTDVDGNPFCLVKR